MSALPREYRDPSPGAPFLRLGSSQPRGRSGIHQVEFIMGTAIGIDVRDPGVPVSAVLQAFDHLRDIDRRFSMWKPDSEMSRLAWGELELPEASPDLRWVMGLCDDLERLTGGYFDARRHRADGLPDPTGVVKGWAVEDAGFILREAGAENFCINAGGDIIAAGSPGDGAAWRIGIRHPHLADRLARVLSVRDRAVATSGTYERGAHIVDPHSGAAAESLVSLTVVGPSLTYADAYATAAFAMGLDGPAWIARQPGFDAFAITSDDRTLATPGLAQYEA